MKDGKDGVAKDGAEDMKVKKEVGTKVAGIQRKKEDVGRLGGQEGHDGFGGFLRSTRKVLTPRSLRCKFWMYGILRVAF